MMAHRRSTNSSFEHRDHRRAPARAPRRGKRKKAATDPYAFENQNEQLPPGADVLTDEELRGKLPYWVDIG